MLLLDGDVTIKAIGVKAIDFSGVAFDMKLSNYIVFVYVLG